MKREKSCGAVVYRTTNAGLEFLLTRNRNGGHWAFPKGHVEGGETEQETALREIKEETGLTVQLDSAFRYVMTYSPAPDVSKDVVYFTAEAVEDEAVRIQEEEVLDYCWLTADLSMAQLTYDNDKKLLEAAILSLTDGMQA